MGKAVDSIRINWRILGSNKEIKEKRNYGVMKNDGYV